MTVRKNGKPEEKKKSGAHKKEVYQPRMHAN
jgi:hypothetical protein